MAEPEPSPPRVLLAIESSCDETAAAVIDENLVVRSNVVASQTDIHRRFGGVVPEMASRAHVQRILPVVDEALRQAQVKLDDLCAIAVVTQSDQPGTPCGPCRQLLWEYCGDIDVTLANLKGQRVDYKLSALLPHPFSFSLED